MTTDVMEQVMEKLRHRAAGMDAIGGTVLLDFGNDQGILIDGSQSPMDVRNASEKADCRVRLGLELLKDILDGRRQAFAAFTTGEIGINGDMSVAIKLQPMLRADGVGPA